MTPKQPTPPYTAFTINYNFIVEEIFSPATISNYFNPSDKIETKKALWDTGASGSIINMSLADQLQLPLVGKRTIQTADGTSEVNEYVIKLFLPNRVVFNEMLVCGSNLGSGTDILIGMNVIQVGDFSISNAQRKTMFSYCVPPFENKMDFVQRAEQKNQRIIKRNKRLLGN